MRFVILNHQPPTSQADSADRTSRPHFDLMFEKSIGKDLKTFAVEELPRLDQQVDLTVLPDHRSAYLTYEGEVSRGRGFVTRFASGNWSGELSADEDVDLVLTFQDDSANFSGQTWALRIDYESKSLLRFQ